MGVVIDMDYFMGLMVFICALLGITVVVAICRQGGKSEKYWGPFKKRLNCVGCGYVSEDERALILPSYVCPECGGNNLQIVAARWELSDAGPALTPYPIPPKHHRFEIKDGDT